ncbi:MAG: HAD family hydrolase [Thermofilaceae archaeon]
MGTVRFVSLDLDGTLVTKEYVDYFWLELVPRLYAKRYGVSLNKAKREVLSKYNEVGSQDLRWYIPRYWFTHLGLSLELLPKALEEAGQLVKPYEDAMSFLNKAQGKVELVLCTSASREFIDLVFNRVPTLAESVSRVFSSVSDFLLPGKPVEFYKAVLRVLRAAPRDVIHVGDDPDADYRVPLSIGIKAYLIDRSGKCGPNSLLELLDIIA